MPYMLKYYYDPFKKYDPFEGEVNFSPFDTGDLFPELIDNARVMLLSRSSDQVRKIVEIINLEILRWFKDQDAEMIDLLQKDGRLDLLYIDENNVASGIKLEAMDDYTWPTYNNTNAVSALRQVAFDIVEKGIEGIPNLKQRELFAAQALSHIGDFVLRSEERFNIATGAFEKFAINAQHGKSHYILLSQYLMLAIHGFDCCLEINGWDSIDKIHQQKLLKHESEIRDALKADLEKEYKEQEKQETRNWSKKSNASRHAKNREAKKVLQDLWLQNTTQFNSAEKCVEHYAPVMHEKGYDYSHRVMTEWIREKAKELKIKWR